MRSVSFVFHLQTGEPGRRREPNIHGGAECSSTERWFSVHAMQLLPTQPPTAVQNTTITLICQTTFGRNAKGCQTPDFPQRHRGYYICCVYNDVPTSARQQASSSSPGAAGLRLMTRAEMGGHTYRAVEKQRSREAHSTCKCETQREMLEAEHTRRSTSQDVNTFKSDDDLNCTQKCSSSLQRPAY